MNEIVLIGEVSSNITYFENDKILTLYLKVYNHIFCNHDYIPVNFKSMNYGDIKNLKGKEIAISGHIEMRNNPIIFVDAFSY